MTIENRFEKLAIVQAGKCMSPDGEIKVLFNGGSENDDPVTWAILALMLDRPVPARSTLAPLPVSKENNHKKTIRFLLYNEKGYEEVGRLFERKVRRL